MEKKNILTQAVALAMIAGFSQAASAQGVSVTDYDEATSAYEEAYVNGTFNAGKTRADAQSSYNLDLGVDYDQVLASPDRDLRLQASGSGSVGRGGGAGNERDSRYEYGASATIDNYFNPASSPAFWYGSLSLAGNDVSNSRQITGIIGAGYGRVTNVTPMAKAIRVVEELQSRGVIADAPALSVYQAAANIIDREAEYRSKHGAADYQEIWINDVAKSLQGANTSGEAFEAAEIIRIYEILTNERISTRRVGWKVRAGVGYVFRSFDGNSDSDPALEVGAEYHYPLSNQTQFSNEALMTTVLSSGDQSYNLRNVMTLTHEVDDSIDWENSWTMTHDIDGPSDTTKTINTLSTAFIYELRNELDLTTTLSLSNYSGDETPGNANGTDTALFVGVRYRLK